MAASGESNRILLLKFDPDGRLVIARNNPDHARAVVVLVPGIDAAALGPADLMGRAESFYRHLAPEPDDETVSVITWLDYAPPRSPRDARDPAHAERGALPLARFIAVLPVTSQLPGGPRLTVVGHGYGGLVAGLAARDHGLAAHALVLLGSAGAGAETASGLRVDGPVYATSPDVNGDGTPYGVHGPRPDAPEFGATVLQPGPLAYGGDPLVRYLPSLRRIALAH